MKQTLLGQKPILQVYRITNIKLKNVLDRLTKIRTKHQNKTPFHGQLLCCCFTKQLWSCREGPVNLTTLLLDRLTYFKRLHILSSVTGKCPSRISGWINEGFWPDRLSNPGPLALESDELPTESPAKHSTVRRMLPCVCDCQFILTCILNMFCCTFPKSILVEYEIQQIL